METTTCRSPSWRRGGFEAASMHHKGPGHGAGHPGITSLSRKKDSNFLMWQQSKHHQLSVPRLHTSLHRTSSMASLFPRLVTASIRSAARRAAPSLAFSRGFAAVTPDAGACACARVRARSLRGRLVRSHPLSRAAPHDVPRGAPRGCRGTHSLPCTLRKHCWRARASPGVSLRVQFLRSVRSCGSSGGGGGAEEGHEILPSARPVVGVRARGGASTLPFTRRPAPTRTRSSARQGQGRRTASQEEGGQGPRVSAGARAGI